MRPLLTYSIVLITCSIVLPFSSWSQTRVEQTERTDLRRRLEETVQQARKEEEEKKYSDGESIPIIVPGEEEDIGPQFYMAVQPRKKWIRASVDNQFYYTSNVFLTEDTAGAAEEEDTHVMVSTADFAFAPDPWELGSGKFYFQLGFRHQWYNYDLMDGAHSGLNNLDFDAQTVYTDFIYQFANTWTAQVGFDWQRLLTHEPPVDDYSEFYKEYVPEWSLTKDFPVGENMMFSITYDGKYHFTEAENVDPDTNDRTVHSLLLSYIYSPLENFFIQTYYNFEFTRYIHQKDPTDNRLRNDYLQTLGINTFYYITDWASVRAFFSYDKRESDSEIIADYYKFDTGGGVSLNISY
ncbi:MAG: hypothetical protein AAF984_06015 [Verrucomicrobiota bacterium]